MDANELIFAEELETNCLPNITLSNDQLRAQQAICDWYSDEKRSTRFVLAGLAGTGKSTILPFVLEKLGLARGNVHYCAYTGKAALVLQRKGLYATTIHRLIYDAMPQPDGSFEFELKTCLGKHLKLIVVDEASMVGKEMQTDLESFRIPVLYVGDHGQLPPVGDDFAKLMQTPDIRLEQIHRQAEGNAIIKAAMMARNNGKIPHGKLGGTVVKLRKLTLPEDKLVVADQVLCGKNFTRHSLNEQIRKMLGHVGNAPDAGEKFICLQNDWNLGLVNGMIGTLKNIGDYSPTLKLTRQNGDSYERPLPHFSNCLFTDELDQEYKHLNIDASVFALKKPGEYARQVKQFDYGYAITVHKAQGSQFENLIVFEEWLGPTDTHRTWLYTAITRAIENLIIVQG